MNIKNEETHQLARRVADITGESLTQAVTIALQERLERLIPQQSSQAEKKYARIMATLEAMAPHAADLPSRAELDDMLYDPETGLPR